MSTPQLLTIDEAAAQLGLSPNTVRNYLRDGRLKRAPGTGGRGKRTYILPADLEAVRGLKQAYDDRRRQKREEIEAAGARECSGCHQVLALECFEPHPAGIAGRHSRCKECRLADHRALAQRNREKRCEYKRQYRAKNREKVRAYKREWQRRITRERGGPWQNLRRYFNERHHIMTALEWGQTSPTMRREGFSLCRDMDGNYSAVRLDMRLESGQRAYAHYTYLPEFGRWVVTAPPLGAPYPELLQRLIDREKRKTTAKGPQVRSKHHE